MLTRLLHPSDRTLTAFATRDLSRSAHVRVARHILRCAACSLTVDEVKALCGHAASPAQGEARRQWTASVLQRRGNGERIILPSPASESAGTPRPRVGRAVATVAAAALVFAVLLQWPPVARASVISGELRFVPAMPTPGSRVQVRYTAPGGLGSEPVLYLRGRWRDADPMTDARSSAPIVAAELRRSGTGYSGEFQYPAEAALGIFVVEDSSGSRVDSRLGRHWVLLAGDGSDVLFDAVRAYWTELMQNSFSRAYQLVRGATEQFPDRPEAWAMLAYLERTLLQGPAAESSLVAHSRRLGTLHNAAAARRVMPTEEIAALYRYADVVSDTARRAVWRARLLAEAPSTRVAVQERMAQAFRAHWQREPSVALDSLETYWISTTAVRSLLAQQGLILAKRIGDPELLRRWAARSVEATPSSAAGVALDLAALPALRSEALAQLRLLETSREFTARPLLQNRAEHAFTEAERRAATLAAYGRAHLIAGDTAAAAARLKQAANLAWSKASFEYAYRALIALGDTAEAVRNAARLVADPATATMQRAALDTASRRAVGQLAWENLVVAARQEMFGRTLSGSQVRALPGNPRVWTSDGTSLRLQDVLSARPTILAMISRYCGYSLEELPALAEFARAMKARGVDVIAVTADPRSADLALLLSQRGVSVPLYYDLQGEVNDALMAWETPTYYVLDATGKLRFSKSQRADMPRQVDALLASRVAGGTP